MENKEQLLELLHIAQNALIKADKQYTSKNSNEHYALYNIIMHINKVERKIADNSLSVLDI